MSVIEIIDINFSELDPNRLLWRTIDTPKKGDRPNAHYIQIGGWAIGRNSKVIAVDIINEDRLIQTAPVIFPRSDVAIRYPEINDTDPCAFLTDVGVVGMNQTFELLLQAIHENGDRTSLATIRAKRQPLRTSFEPKLQPLMITSMGRSGTTWLMHILSNHPQLLVHKVYPYETRSASYWIHMLKVLSQPANHYQSSHPDTFQDNFFWVGHYPSYFTGEQADVNDWLMIDYIEKLTTFCQSNIEAFYGQIAIKQKAGQPIYFIEKYHDGHIPRLLWELYEQAKEIFLIRDFRDMLCSIQAFNAKRGYTSFGRELVNSDEEFVWQLRDNMLRLLQSWKLRLNKGYLLRYEDLVLNPFETLLRVLNYLNLDASDSIIENMIEEASNSNKELHEHKTSEHIKASIGRWKRDLSPSLKAICEEAFADILNEFGYSDAYLNSLITTHISR
jgi:hypothetical protein